MTDLHTEMVAMGDKAVCAARALALIGHRKKGKILQAMGDQIDKRKADIKKANAVDMSAAGEAGLSSAMLDRLELTDKRIDGMVRGLVDVAGLKDPVGDEISRCGKGR